MTLLSIIALLFIAVSFVTGVFTVISCRKSFNNFHGGDIIRLILDPDSIIEAGPSLVHAYFGTALTTALSGLDLYLQSKWQFDTSGGEVYAMANWWLWFHIMLSTTFILYHFHIRALCRAIVKTGKGLGHENI